MANPNESNIIPASSALVQTAGGLANINPAGLSDDALNEYKAKVQEQVNAMQHAYDQPNWFKFAAGMLKPQLGGFFASLGSGAEALGQNVEQQRAMQVPIAQQKIEIARADVMLGQRQKQNQIYQQWLATGKPMDGQTFQKIAQFGDSPILSAAKEYWDQAQKQVNLASSAEKAAQSSKLLDSAMRNFALAAADPTATAEQIKEKSDNLDKALADMRPYGVDKQKWDGLGRTEQAQVAIDYATKTSTAALTAEEEFAKESENAINRLRTLSTIRDLTLGKGLSDTWKDEKTGEVFHKSGRDQMAEALGIFQGNNMFDVIANALDAGKGPQLFAQVSKLERQHLLSPDARDKFQELVKQLASNQLALSSHGVRPTDMYRTMVNEANPNIGNTQGALVSILDIIAHDDKRSIDNFKGYMDSHKRPNEYRLSNSYLDRQRLLNDERDRVAISAPSYDTPYFYNPAAPFLNRGQQTQQTTTPAAQPATPSTGGQSRARPTEITTPTGTIRRSANGQWSASQP